MKKVEKNKLDEIIEDVCKKHNILFTEEEIDVILEICSYFAESIRFPFMEGQYIQKRNKDLFRNGSKIAPVIRIEHFTKQLNKSNNYKINGIYILNPLDIIAISEEDAKAIIDIWNDSAIVHPPVKINDFAHIREDNGNVKVSLKSHRVQKVLFAMRMKFPESKFQAYICPECRGIHIGKTVDL